MHDRPHGSILRRAGPLMLARLGVAALTFAIPLVLARVLLPESYGTFKQAWLLSNTLFLVLPLGLNQSLVYFVPREPGKKRFWETHALILTSTFPRWDGDATPRFVRDLALAATPEWNVTVLAPHHPGAEWLP